MKAILACCCATALLGCVAERPGSAAASVAEEQIVRLLSLAEVEAAAGTSGELEVNQRALPFVRVGVRWDAEDDDALEVRTGVSADALGPWRPVTQVYAEGAVRAGHVEAAPGSTAFQLRIVRGHRAPTYIFSESIETLGEPAAVDAEPLPPLNLEVPATTGPATLRQALAPVPPIQSRASWGARAPTCSSPTSPYRAVIHHSDSPTVDTVTPEARLRSIQAYHMDTRGYCDIAYNYLTSRDARVWTGRGATVLGGHTLGANPGNVANCYIGTYQVDQVTDAQMCNGAGLLAWLHTTYGIPLNRTAVKGHREYGQTDCPGNTLFARLDEMVNKANNGCTGTTTPAYAAQFVRQSYPASQVGAVELQLGQSVDGFFEMKNVGTATWQPASTRIVPTPRDVKSPLQATNWISANRISAVLATTPPGATGRWNVRLTGNSLGDFEQTFGFVDELKAWFADQGGPPENFLRVKVHVVPRVVVDSGTPDAGEVDAGEPPPVELQDAGNGEPPDPTPTGNGSDTSSEGSGRAEALAPVIGGCGCGMTDVPAAFAFAFALLMGAGRRRRDA